MTDNKYDAVVVGGGVAGLAATTYLTRSGKKVLLIEKNSECGGLVNTFVRNGFHFDAGVRALLDAGIIYPMLKDLNIRLDVVKSPVSLGIENEIIHIETLASLSEYSELLKKFFPASGSEIDELLSVIRRVIRHMDVLYGVENPFFKDLIRDPGFIFTKLLPWFPRFLLTVKKINRMNAPVEDYLKTIIKDNSLRDMISQHFFKNTPSFFALSYFSLYLDYFYPRGGVGRLADVLKNKLLELGGEIRTETKITGVFPGEHYVVDDKDTRYYYKNLVWAADLKTLYRKTETEGLSPDTIKKIGETKATMLANRGGDSVYTLFVEVDEPPESFGKIGHGHFFYTPVRQGLGETHRSELDDLLRNFTQAGKDQILAWMDRFTSLNTYEVSIPVLKDPSMAPPGKTGLIISILAEYDLFRLVRDAGWLEEFTRELEDRVLKILSGSVYPMLKDKVIERFSFTPLSIENRAGSSEGGLTGWAFQKEMPVINKIQLAEGAVLTPIPCVYQAGQWVYSPGGVPMSILTGKLAADRILKK